MMRIPCSAAISIDDRSASSRACSIAAMREQGEPVFVAGAIFAERSQRNEMMRGVAHKAVEWLPVKLGFGGGDAKHIVQLHRRRAEPLIARAALGFGIVALIEHATTVVSEGWIGDFIMQPEDCLHRVNHDAFANISAPIRQSVRMMAIG